MLRDGRVEVPYQGGAHDVLVAAEMESSIRDIALAEPFTTLTNIQRQLLLQLQNIHVSVSTIARHSNGFFILTKITGKNADVATVRRQSNEKGGLTELEIHERLNFIDESGCNLYTRRTKGTYWRTCAP